MTPLGGAAMSRPADEALAVETVAAHARHNRGYPAPRGDLSDLPAVPPGPGPGSATAGPTWTIRATQFMVSVLPEGNGNYRNYALRLDARPGDRWVITTGHGDYLNDAGEWTWGLDPGDEWIAAHWHTFDRAVELATAAALDVEVNGRTARDVLAALEGVGQR